MKFTIETTNWGVTGNVNNALDGFNMRTNYEVPTCNSVGLCWAMIRDEGYLLARGIRSDGEPTGPEVGINGRHIIAIQGPIE